MIILHHMIHQSHSISYQVQIFFWSMFVDFIEEPIELYQTHPSVSPSTSMVPKHYRDKIPKTTPNLIPHNTAYLSCPGGAVGLLPQLDCVSYHRCRLGVCSQVKKALVGRFRKNVSTSLIIQKHGVTSCHSLQKKEECRKDNSCIWNET